MDYSNMVGDAFEYAKEGVWGRWARWILLVVSYIIFPLLLGYGVRIYRGEKPAPELEEWGRMFVDGLLLFVIGLIYAIPVLLILAIFGGAAFSAILAGGDQFHPGLIAASIGSLFIGIVLAIVVGIIISLIAAIGVIRFARKESFGAAFQFGAILEHIGRIGWLNYIGALIILWLVGIVYAIVIGTIGLIPFVGWLIGFFVAPAWSIFQFRYMTLIYESAEAPV
jgi:hypothetical protein